MLKILHYFIAGLTLLVSFSAWSQTSTNSDTYVISEIQSGGSDDLILIRPQASTPVANPARCGKTDWYVLLDVASDFQRAMVLTAVHSQREVRLFIAANVCSTDAPGNGFPVVSGIRFP